MDYDALKPPDPASWLETDEDERTSACARYHRQLKGEHPRGGSPGVHAIVHVVVENQLAMGEPPQARAALERLLGGGLDRHEAIHAIAGTLSVQIWEALSKGGRALGQEYVESLETLSAESWRRGAPADDASGDGVDVDDDSRAEVFADPDALEHEEDDGPEHDHDAEFEHAPETFRREEPRAAPNDRCPCGSGKKYKRCCQARDVSGGTARPTPGSGSRVSARTTPAGPQARHDPGPRIAFSLSDRLPTERTLAKLSGGLRGERRGKPAATDEAQQWIYEAWDSSEKEQRIALAQKALAISADCADAYVILAEEEAADREQARGLFARGVAAAERALGPAPFTEFVGQFWSLVETRPYMRARRGLAKALWELGERDAAIAHYAELLRLNEDDNLGVRHVLMGALIEVGKDEEAARLLARYKADGSAAWAYARALLEFRKRGDAEAGRNRLAEAISANPHVPDYLLGALGMPAELPRYMGRGDENEAVVYVAESSRAWSATAGALAWLASARPRVRRAGRRQEDR